MPRSDDLENLDRRVTRGELEALLETLATKSDLERFATKSDLDALRTEIKSDFRQMSDECHRFVTVALETRATRTEKRRK